MTQPNQPKPGNAVVERLEEEISSAEREDCAVVTVMVNLLEAARDEIDALESTLSDEEAAHQETLAMLQVAAAERDQLKAELEAVKGEWDKNNPLYRKGELKKLINQVRLQSGEVGDDYKFSDGSKLKCDFQGDLSPGDIVSVKWKSDCDELEPITDIGVIFTLPCLEEDDAYMGGIVMIPRPQNPGGKGALEAAWMTLSELEKLDQVESIRAVRLWDAAYSDKIIGLLTAERNALAEKVKAMEGDAEVGRLVRELRQREGYSGVRIQAFWCGDQNNHSQWRTMIAGDDLQALQGEVK